MTRFEKNGEPIEVETWGIYANGDFKGSALTVEEARDCIDQMASGTLYRPRTPRHMIQVTEYNTHGNTQRDRTYRG